MNGFFEQLERLLCDLGRKNNNDGITIVKESVYDSKRKDNNVTIVVNENDKKRVLKMKK